MYEMKEKEMIFVFTGPDGSGRKTVADMVGSTLGLHKVISYTSRSRRPSEVDGQDYHFVGREAFEQGLANGDFIESVELDGNYYGIKEQDIRDQFGNNDFIYLIMNTNGAKRLKELFGDKVTRIFIHTDQETILKRLDKEGASSERLERHKKHYAEDMAYMLECKHAIENADLAHTVFAVTNLLEQYMDRQLVDKD